MKKRINRKNIMNNRELIVKSHQVLSFNKIFSSTGKGEDIFWPGCAVLSMGSELIDKTYKLLKTAIPGLSYSTSCCGKPSKHVNHGKDFSNRKKFLENIFKENGIKNIYTLCPNCFVTLDEFNEVNVKSAWHIIDEYFPESCKGILNGRQFSLHDPCPITNNIEVTEYIRSILYKMGAEILEFANNREKTVCCGKKDMLMTLNPEKGKRIFDLRASQAPSKNIVTYCASCKDTFKQNSFNSYHVLELLFQIETSSSWINRYRAVKKLRRRNENA